MGATTGGASLVVEAVSITLSLLFGGPIGKLLELFPPALVGVILFLTGTQNALWYFDFSTDKNERFTTFVMAAFAIWNVCVAFLAGAVMLHSLRRGWMRPLVHC